MNQPQAGSRCSLCEKVKAKFLFTKEEADIYRCANCGLVYHSPQREPEQEIEVYRQAALAKESASEFIKTRELLLKYLLTQLNQQFSDKPKGKLLDIGCQFGYFLELAGKDGWQTFGLDVSLKATNFARERLGLDVFTGTVKQANFPDEHFDVVTIWEVLNQMPQPLQELQQAQKVLKPDGVIIFRLQNADFHLIAHYLYQCFKVVFKFLRIPDISKFHIYEFSPRSIKAALQRVGFKEIKVKNSRLTEGDLYGSFSRRGQIVVGALKKLFSFCLSILYYLSARKIVLAPSMIVRARKQADA
ncbi:MAG: class I SAM-dependent methyltransferase [Candidatus Omnitrophica bacterium]|nr:class I SAM-dependent methyltransferase [Candidatus Omnitrophota bacterium]